MNKSQRAALRMYHRVFAVLDGDPDAWNMAPPIVSAETALRAEVSEIERLARIQTESQTKGHTQDKRALKQTAIDRTMDLVQRLRPFARVADDGALLALVDVSASDLAQPAEEEFVDRCEAIVAAAREKQPEMDGYGLTADLIDATAAALAAFDPQRSTPSAIRDRRAAATRALPARFTAAIAQREILDDLIPALVQNPDLVAAYQQARRIDNAA